MLAALLIVLGLVALPLLATLGSYATARHRGETGTEALGLPETIRAVLEEAAATGALVATLPLRLHPARPPTASRGVILLIPELYCSSGSLRSLAHRLAEAGWITLAAAEHPSVANYETVKAGLDARIERVPAGVDVVLLGHGGGGLLAAHYAATHPRVGRVVTLATPHQGSRALLYRWIGPDARTPAGITADVVAIYSDFDAWLVPVDDAYCPGGFNIAIGGIGHCAMPRSARVADLVIENLASAPATRAL